MKVRTHYGLLTALIIAVTVSTEVGAQTGTAIWGKDLSTTPRYNDWTDSAFAGEQNAIAVGGWRVIAGAEAPTRDEIFVLGVATDNVINGLRWDGTSWFALPLNPLATVTDDFWWGFDVAYEQQSGDAVLVWNNGSTGSRGLSYAVWNGIVWTIPDSITTPQSGEPKHMHLAANPNSDEMVLVVSNSTSQDYALVWNGSTWGNGNTLDTNGSGDDRTDIYVAYEQQSGRALVTYGDDNSHAHYRFWDGLVWSGEDTVAIALTASGNVQWTRLGAEPGTNRIALGVLTDNQDIWLNVWDGVAWDTSVTATNSALGTTFPAVDVAFEGVSGKAVAAYGEAASVRYRTWTGGSGWSAEGTAANIGAGPNSLALAAAPNSDQIMLAVQDDNEDLNYVRWDGVGWGALAPLETSSGETKNQPFLFLYDIGLVDLAVGMGVSNGSPAEGDTIVYSITVSNNSDDTSTSVQITDSLPTGVTYVADSTTQGTYVPGTGIWNVGTLPDSGIASLVLTVTVDIGTSGTKIVNQAFVTAVDQTDINPGNDSGSTTISVKISSFRLAEGTYVGNGDSLRALTVLDFAPDLVIVKAEAGEFSIAKSSTMSNKGSKELGDNQVLRGDGIVFLDDSGFTIGSGTVVNAPGITYYWAAFQAAPGKMAVGSYPGDGMDNVSISTAKFQPDYVIVMSESGEHAMQRFADQLVDKSFEFKNSDAKGDRIQDFEPNGFQIGKHNTVNKSGVTHHFVAWKATAGRMGTGLYVGSGNDYDSITTVGFDPEYLLIKRDGGSKATIQRSASVAGDLSLPVHDDAPFPDGIQAFLSDGFELGQDDHVNKSGSDHFWVAFRDNRPPVLNAIGPQSVDEVQNLNFGVSATDPDADSIILTAESVPTNATFVDNFDGTGTFDFDPDFTQAGVYNVRFIATDGSLDDSEVVAITVNHVNVKPLIDSIGPKSVDEGQNLNFGVSATDLDADSIILTAENVPTNATFVDHFDGTGTFDFNPDFTQAGVYNVRFIAADTSLADTEMVAITVSDDHTVYYVSTTGDDSADGLSAGTAWQSIDNGDKLGVLNPGDTVNVLSGTYSITSSIWFKISGTAAKPITYRTLGATRAIVDANWVNDQIIRDSADHVVIEGLELTRTNLGGISLYGDSCIVMDCYVHDVVQSGFYVTGSHNMFVRNIAANIGGSAVHNVSGAVQNRYYGNTFMWCGSSGIYLLNGVSSARIFNNILISNDYGIRAEAGNVCGFNDSWNNSIANYAGGAFDSAGGISANPLLADPGNDDFSLLGGSPALDQGLDLGYPFLGTAPEMGADESNLTNLAPVWDPIGPRSVDEGQHLDFAVHATDPDLTTPSLMAENIPVNAAFVDSGNGWGGFVFDPDFTQAGTYDVRFIASDGGLADTEVVTITVNDDHTVYYAKPTGDDSADGLSALTAWQSVDNGDNLGILTPGDTVIVLAGTYLLSGSVMLTSSGTAAAPIVYRNPDSSGAILDANGGNYAALQVNGSHLVVAGLELTNTSGPSGSGIELNGDSCTVRACYVHDVSNYGAALSGTYNRLQRCILAHTGSDGVRMPNGGDNNEIYGNTILDVNGTYGIAFWSAVNTGRAFNNIIDSVNLGIWALSGVVAAANNIWRNSGSAYFGGVSDSAGGLALDPLYVDAAAGDFRLQNGSPAVDAGIDVGYPYLQTAPDMGALESNFIASPPVLDSIGPQVVAEGLHLEFAVHATDPEPTVPSLTAENVPANASFVDSGNGWGGFVFDPDFIQAGTYPVRFVASDGVRADTEVVTITVTDDHTVYYVSPTGDDSADGLSAGTAWLSIENGDNLDEVTPGDTVIILPGTFSLTACVFLNDSGTATRPIVYRASAPGTSLIDLNNANDTALCVRGSHLRIEGLEIANAQLDGIALAGDSCTVSGCRVRDIGNDGIELSGHGHLILRNIVATIGDDAITIRDFSTGIHLFGNTIYNASGDGTHVEPGVTGCRIFNNIYYDVAWGNYGPGPNSNTYGWNLHWIWSLGIAWGGAIDSGGQFIIADPLFTDAPGGDFTLQAGSPAIDAGLDQGYPFLGSAPEMGADETNLTNSPPTLNPIGPQVVDEGQNLNFIISATDPDPPTPLLLADTLLPANATFLDNGDGTGTFDFNPDFFQSGSYDILFTATDGGLLDTERVTITVNDVDRPPVLDSIGPKLVTEGQNLNFSISASDPDSAIPVLTAENLPANASFADSGDGTGVFDFNPNFTQAGSYVVRFIATHGALADTELVSITVDLGPLAYIRVELSNRSPLGDTSLTTDNDTTQLFARGYTAGDSLIGDIEVIWTLEGVDTIGSVLVGPDTTSTLTLFLPGTSYIMAVDTAGHADTTGLITCTAGIGVSLAVLPDTATLTTDSSLLFTYTSLDADGNLSDPQALATWSVLGGIGTIDSASGWFDPTTVGTGAVAAEAGSFGDTSGAVVVTAGTLDHLAVTPDTSGLRVGDTLQFAATGYDADTNAVPAGTITWRVLGAIGQIDSTGQLVVERPGTGWVSAASSLAPVADTTTEIVVDELWVQVNVLGVSTVRPGSDWTAVLSVRLENYYGSAKQLNQIMVRDASSGPGLPAELLSNVDSVALFEDTDDNALLGGGDVLQVVSAYDADTAVLAWAGQTIASNQSRSYLVAFKTSLWARDGDTLDVYTVTSTDIGFADSTPVVGPDPANSSGFLIVDGSVAAQYATSATGTGDLDPGDSLYHVMTVEIPRNGYVDDTLLAFSVENAGTSTPADLDSLLLFGDNGNGAWGGAGEETRLGRLVFTGDRWTVTGINALLPDSLNRFFLAADLSAYPTNNATLALAIPTGGVGVASNNDGPLDVPVVAPDTLTIRSPEMITITKVPIPAQTLVPAASSGPLLGLNFLNGHPFDVDLDSLVVTLLAIDPEGASQAQLDSQIDSLQLYHVLDGDLETLGPGDTLIATATLAAGRAQFTTPGLQVSASGGTADYVCVAWMSAGGAKNGNVINLMISAPAEVFVTPGASLAGTFPLANDEWNPIDVFPAALAPTQPLGDQTYFGGQAGRLAFAFALPANGYATDSLASVRLVNAGNLDRADLLTLRLWFDVTGDGLTLDDTLLGQIPYTAPFWQLTGIDFPLQSSVTPLLVTIDVADSSFDGGTLQFEVPTGGVTYRSGVVGPDDASIVAPETHLVLPSNRLTVVSVPANTATVAPASSGHLLLTFALYNGYVGLTKTLEAVRLTNLSHTHSTPAFADTELATVVIYLDANKDRALGGDSLLATGFFSGGVLQLSGLNVTLPPESLSYFFVTVDLPARMIDGDSLAVGIVTPSDLTFSDAVLVNGDLPLTSAAWLVVDGSVTAQFEEQGVAARTLSPGETDVPVFAFKPAANGDLADILQQVTIVNRLDADTTDLSSMSLWLDTNGDDTWQISDSLLGSMSYGIDAWSIGALTLPVGPAPPPTLFVLIDVAPLARPNFALRAAIPTGGCVYGSANDGPRNDSLISSYPFTISNSGLRIARASMDTTYSVGQSIEVRTTVTNVLALPIDTVLGVIVAEDDPLAVTLDSVSAGPDSIDAGEATDFVWYYTAANPGQTRWTLRADAPTLPDSSGEISTPVVTIQSAPIDVQVQLINSIPTAVTRGQANVFPLSISYAHPQSAPTSATIRLDSLQLQVEDGTGTPLAADQVLRRIVLASGTQTIASTSVIPASPWVWLRFTQPVDVAPGQSQQYSLLVDIDSSAAASQFALALASPGAIPLVDRNTSLPVSLDAGLVFPMRTASCRIDEASSQLAVRYQSLLAPAVNFGQDSVPVMRLYLRHPGTPGQSQIQVSSLSLGAEDSTGTGLSLLEVFEQLTVVSAGFPINDVSGGALAGTSVAIELDQPVTLSPGQVDSLDIVADVQGITAEPGFDFVIADSSSFVVRDLSSGSPLTTNADTGLSSGLVFPFASGWTTFLRPADAPWLCVSSAAPGSVLAGTDSVTLLDLTFALPAAVLTSPVHLHSIAIRAQDSLGTVLDPNALFDRMAFSVDGGAIEYRPFVELDGTNALFTLTDSLVILVPGDTVQIMLLADLEADVAYDHFQLQLASVSDVAAHDATDSTRIPAITGLPGCVTSIPFTTATTQIFLPAGSPELISPARELQMAARGDTGVVVYDGALAYFSATTLADVQIDSITAKFLSHTVTGPVSAAPASVFDRVELWLDGTRVAVDSVLSADSIRLALPVGYALNSGSSVAIEIRGDVRSDAADGQYVLQFADSSCVGMQDPNSGLRVFPTLASGDYPVRGTDISVSAAGLSESFSNYPNPFNPSQGETTTIAYSLSQDGRVDIEIFSITGTSVRLLVRDEFRAAGNYTTDIWTGLNDIGLDVQPGTYFCQIRVRYASGTEEVSRRKVALVR